MNMVMMLPTSQISTGLDTHQLAGSRSDRGTELRADSSVVQAGGVAVEGAGLVRVRLEGGGNR